MLPLDGRSAPGDTQAATALFPPGQIPDVVLANAIAHAVRAVPGVVDLSQGLFAKAATYGPREHVAGVVLQHLASGDLSVEIHVVLDEATCLKALWGTSAESTTVPALLGFTDSIRTAVSQTLGQLGLPPAGAVNVTIDDIR